MADFRPDIEPSNVRPSMGTYNTPKTFRFWCQKVLPLVYDDSLSYYELLCKVVDYLNKTMEDVNTAVEDVTNLNNAFGSLENHVNASETALLQAYTDLQNYVNGYFDSLDFQQAINDKLDEMAKDGTLDALLLPHFNEYVQTTNTEIQQITQNMEENVLNYIAEARGQIRDATSNMENTLNTAINAQDTRIGVVENEFDQLIALQTAGTMQGAKITTFRAVNPLEYTTTTSDVLKYQSFSFVDHAGNQNTNPSMSVLDGLVNPTLVSAGAYVLDNQTDPVTGKCIYINLSSTTRFYPTGGFLGNDPDKRAVRFSVNYDAVDIYPALTGKWLVFEFSVLSDVPTDLSEVTNIRVGADGTTYPTAGDAVREQIEKKVNIPLDENDDPINGINGQILKTNGDGSTAWTDPIPPSDQQVEEAVSEWLAVHPEATTTVQDASLTFDKFTTDTNIKIDRCYDTVAQMIADTSLLNGVVCQTLGYYTVNDGGGALYRIYSIVPTTYYETLTNGLYAELMYINGIVTSEQLGTLTTSVLNGILSNSSIKEVNLTGSITIDTPLVITTPKRIVSHDFTVHQTSWGYPAIDIESDDVSILGVISLIMDVTTRTAITNSTPHYHPNSADPKSDSTGIMLGWQTSLKNFTAERINVKNFIAGITNTALVFKNVHVDYLYVENVDFGVFGAHYINTYFRCVEFKDIASYVGSADPSHAIYLTGGNSVGLSEGFTVDYVMGSGCNSKKTDTVISVKSTVRFACNGGYVSEISALCSALTSTGYIQNITVEDSTSGISTQLENTDFIFRNLVFKKIDVVGEYINYFTGASHAKVVDCEFNVNSDDSNYAYVFVNGTNTKYHEENCKYASPANSTTKLYNRMSANAYFYVYEPEASIELFTGYTNKEKSYMLLDPKKLNYPKTNCVVPNPHFVPNDLVVTEATEPNYPLGFRTNDKVLVSGANVVYFNNNNETNGNVYTLFNDGTSRITNGARLVTKTGANYEPADWKIFRFMNIGNVAYEI